MQPGRAIGRQSTTIPGCERAGPADTAGSAKPRPASHRAPCQGYLRWTRLDQSGRSSSIPSGRLTPARLRASMTWAAASTGKSGASTMTVSHGGCRGTGTGPAARPRRPPAPQRAAPAPPAVRCRPDRAAAPPPAARRLPRLGWVDIATAALVAGAEVELFQLQQPKRPAHVVGDGVPVGAGQPGVGWPLAVPGQFGPLGLAERAASAGAAAGSMLTPRRHLKPAPTATPKHSRRQPLGGGGSASRPEPPGVVKMPPNGVRAF